MYICYCKYSAQITYVSYIQHVCMYYACVCLYFKNVYYKVTMLDVNINNDITYINIFIHTYNYITDMKQVLTKLRKNGIDLLSTKPLDTSTTTTSSTTTTITTTTTTTSTTSSSPLPSSSGGHNSDPSSGGHISDRETPEVRIENYHEMSMREARRCDLRNGTTMKSLAAATTIPATTNTATSTAIHASSTGAHATSTQSSDAAAALTSTAGVHTSTSTTQPPITLPTATATQASSIDTQASTKDLNMNKDSLCVDLRGHRGVMAVLTEVANPPSGKLASGNWVRVHVYRYMCMCIDTCMCMYLYMRRCIYG